MSSVSPMPHVSSYLPLASAYAVVAGTLYLWGFWSAFDINILQYIGLIDLAKSAAFPLVSAIASIAVGMVIGQLAARPMFPPGGGANTPFGRALNEHVKKYRRLWFAIYIAALFALLFVHSESKWLGVGLLMSGMLSFALANQGVLSEVIADDSMRGIVLGLISVLICGAFGWGRLRADDITSGREYFVVDQSSISHVDGVRTSLVGELRYLGHAGEYVFLLAPDSSIEILRAEAVQAIIVRRTPSPKRVRQSESAAK